MYPELSGLYLIEKYNTHEVNERVKTYAEKMIFGFVFPNKAVFLFGVYEVDKVGTCILRNAFE